MNTFSTVRLAPNYKKRIEELVSKLTIEDWVEKKKLYNSDELLEKIKQEDIKIFICEVEVMQADFFEKVKGLELICCIRGNPVNIDVEAAAKANIIVTACPGRNATAVTELTIGLMIALARKIINAHNLVQNGGWSGLEGIEEAKGIELEGKNVGIVGLGAIGYKVAKILNTMGMNILIYDPYVMPERVKDVNGKIVSLETLMRESDFITIHAVYNKETKDLITEELISLMKPTAYFINVARSRITNEKALVKALSENKIMGAAFDVYNKEPTGRKGSPFKGLKNVITTPHIGGQTNEVVIHYSKMVYESIKEYLTGKTPKYIWKKNIR
ncbi:MAG: NAD(P)-dependent oxidoreductase [Candidatus Helarchaeota archaeon]